MYIRKTFIKIERNYYLNKLIKIITGIRRCGKSYLLDPIFTNYLLNNGVNQDHIIKLDLDSIENDEYKDAKKLYKYVMSKINDNEIKGLSEYINYGGLPLITTLKSPEDKIEYLNFQKNNVYINDVIERNNIKNEKELKTLIEIISSSVGSLTNPTKLYNTFVSKGNKNITNKTISLYLKYLEESYLIEKSKRYDIKGKSYIETPSKYYFVDMGIRNSLINFRQIERNHIMENIIYTELRRRGFCIDVGIVEKRKIDENGKKDYIQLEVDFVANKGSDKYYIQSAYNIEDDNKRQQELQSLLNEGDSFKKIIIVYDSFIKWQDKNGIIYMSIYDFLLNESSLKEA